MRTIFLVALWLINLASTSLGQTSSATPAQASKPNFILIMADDLGYGDLGCYGNSQILTPNIDALASRGARLTDYHANGAVCSPTRAALVTGRYQQRSGISGVVTAAKHRDTGLALEETTFGDVLSQSGYATGLIGKWHLGYSPRFNPIHNGFATFRGYVSGNIDFFSHIDQAGHLDWWKQDVIEDEPGYTTHLITKHSIDFINQYAHVPFCLYVAHEAPHYPYQGPQDEPIRTVGNPGSLQGERKDIANAYREMIEELDKGVGQIVATLEEHDLTSRTMIVFCSDNGANKYGSNGRLKGVKGQIWEGGHRVPAIACWPGQIPAGKTSEILALSMDWFPTMLAAANIAPPDHVALDGHNLLPALADSDQEPSRAVFWSINGAAAVRRGNWKLVRENKRNQETFSLFNLAEDPTESTALENEQLKQQLKAELSDWEKTWQHIPQKS